MAQVGMYLGPTGLNFTLVGKLCSSGDHSHDHAHYQDVEDTLHVG